jgi:hypothetical protein
MALVVIPVAIDTMIAIFRDPWARAGLCALLKGEVRFNADRKGAR